MEANAEALAEAGRMANAEKKAEADGDVTDAWGVAEGMTMMVDNLNLFNCVTLQCSTGRTQKKSVSFPFSRVSKYSKKTTPNFATFLQ